MKARRVWRGLGLVALLPWLGLLPHFAAIGETHMHLPSWPQAMPVWEACTATVEGQALPLLSTAVNPSRTWTSRPQLSRAAVGVFALEGEAEVALTYREPVESAVVRPLSLGIQPVVEGSRVRFPLMGPAQVVVEINGRQEGAVHLFAGPVDQAPPQEGTPGLRVYGPGLWEVGEVALQSGESVYLAEGAVVRGRFFAEGQENITLWGQGIIDGSAFDRWEDQVVPIDFRGCRQVRIEGVTLLDPAAWTVNLYHCSDVVVQGVNIIGARSNSDGITLQSCQNVQVEGCFVRGWDDNLVVKGYDGNVDNISFDRCILWTDLAQSCEIGYETRADRISNIRFTNITVLHANHKPVLSIHNSDNALVENVLFENITVEDCRLGQGDGATFLIDLTTTKSQWSKTAQRGNIRNVTIRNVDVLAGEAPAVRIFAFSKKYTIDGVHISGLRLLGQPIGSFDQLRYTYNNKLGKDIRISEE